MGLKTGIKTVHEHWHFYEGWFEFIKFMFLFFFPIMNIVRGRREANSYIYDTKDCKRMNNSHYISRHHLKTFSGNISLGIQNFRAVNTLDILKIIISELFNQDLLFWIIKQNKPRLNQEENKSKPDLNQDRWWSMYLISLLK